MKPETQDSSLPLTHSVKSCRRLLNVGHTTICQLIRSGELESFRIGRRRIITDAGLQRLIADRLAKAQDAAA